MLYTLKYKNRYCTHTVHDIFFSRIIIIQVREDVTEQYTYGDGCSVCLFAIPIRIGDCPFDTRTSCVSVMFVIIPSSYVCVLSLVFFSPCFLPSTPYYTIFFCVRFLVHYCFLFSEYLKCLLTVSACLRVLPRLSERVCCYWYNEEKKTIAKRLQKKCIKKEYKRRKKINESKETIKKKNITNRG